MSKKFPKHFDIQKFIDERVPKPVPAKSDKNGLIHGAPLNLSAGAALSFVGPIQAHTTEMIKTVTDGIIKLFNSEHAQAHIARMSGEETGQDASVGSQARILTNAFKAQFDKLFGSLSATLAADMVASINANSKQQLNASINGSQQQSPLQQKAVSITLDPRFLDPATVEILKASAAVAAGFIRSIPEQYLNNVSNAVLQSIQTGNGLQDLIPYLEKQGNTTLNWAGNTAMDQTRKTFSALNRTRMQNIGIKRATWIHSGGSQHPRELHEDYDGKTYSLADGAPVGDDGGNNVQTGEEPNCRCTNKPVLNDLFTE
jgi:uncharacterized protein with gpF-like domain